MKQSIKIASLVMIIGATLVSCGPRRYRCGPYRKCEVKEHKTKDQPLIRTYKSQKTNS